MVCAWIGRIAGCTFDRATPNRSSASSPRRHSKATPWNCVKPWGSCWRFAYNELENLFRRFADCSGRKAVVLTRLRVRGFKNLLDVDVRFGPFTCIAGHNGAGKSNLFDAIHFLHLLTKYGIMEAVQQVRDARGRAADPSALFTAFGDYRSPEIRFVADLIVERDVQDDFGVRARAATSALRYELAFVLDHQDGVQRLKITEESLVPMPIRSARKELGFNATKEFCDSCITGRRTKPLISTQTAAGEPEITVHQEGHGGRKLPATSSTRT